MSPHSILVVNAGSSSLKYAPFHGETAFRGQIECILEGGYRDAFAAMLRTLTDPSTGILRDLHQIDGVGHRVVHGGERFHGPALIDDEALAEIERLCELAPLHNPINTAFIREAAAALPGVVQVAIFDSAFHQTLAPEAYLYGLPYELYSEKGFRRFGFHGTSHQYVSRQAAAFLGRPVEELAIITCHLGNGASVCAIDGGRSIDTSMGFTPGEGLIMGMRCGDVDSAVLIQLMRNHGMSADRLEALLSRESGLLGISGLSRDMREIEKAAGEGHARAKLAFDVFCWRLRRYLGAFMAELGRVDAIVFTGGIGQGSAAVRAKTLDRLGAFGITVDETRNREVRGFQAIGRISPEGSPVEVLVVPTDEERMIADEVAKVLSAK